MIDAADEVERLRIGTAALSANLRVAQAAEEKAEAEVEALRDCVAALRGEGEK